MAEIKRTSNTTLLKNINTLIEVNKQTTEVLKKFVESGNNVSGKEYIQSMKGIHKNFSKQIEDLKKDLAKTHKETETEVIAEYIRAKNKREDEMYTAKLKKLEQDAKIKETKDYEQREKSKERYKQLSAYKIASNVHSQPSNAGSAIALSLMTGGVLNPVLAKTLGLDKLVTATTKWAGRKVGNGLKTAWDWTGGEIATQAVKPFKAHKNDYEKGKKSLETLSNNWFGLLNKKKEGDESKGAVAKDKEENSPQVKGIKELNTKAGNILSLLQGKKEPEKKKEKTSFLGKILQAIGGFGTILKGAAVAAIPALVKYMFPKFAGWLDEKFKSFLSGGLGLSEETAGGVSQLVKDALPGALFGMTVGGFKGALIGAGLSIAGNWIWDKVEEFRNGGKEGKTPTKIGPIPTRYVEAAIGGATLGSLFGWKGMAIGAVVGIAGQALWDFAKKVKEFFEWGKDNPGKATASLLGIGGLTTGAGIAASKVVKNNKLNKSLPVKKVKVEHKNALKNLDEQTKKKVKEASTRKEKKQIKKEAKIKKQEINKAYKENLNNAKTEAKNTAKANKKASKGVSKLNKSTKASSKALKTIGKTTKAAAKVGGKVLAPVTSLIETGAVINDMAKNGISETVNDYKENWAWYDWLNPSKMAAVAGDWIADKSIADYSDDRRKKVVEKAHKEMLERMKSNDNNTSLNGLNIGNEIKASDVGKVDKEVKPVTKSLDTLSKGLKELNIVDVIKAMQANTKALFALPSFLAKLLTVPTSKLLSSENGISLPNISGIFSNLVSDSQGGGYGTLGPISSNGFVHGIKATGLKDMGLKGSVVSSNSIPYIASNNEASLKSLDSLLSEWGYEVLYTSAMGGHKTGTGHWKGNKVDLQLKKNGRPTRMSTQQLNMLKQAGYWGSGTGALGWEPVSGQVGGGHYDLFIGNGNGANSVGTMLASAGNINLDTQNLPTAMESQAFAMNNMNETAQATAEAQEASNGGIMDLLGNINNGVAMTAENSMNGINNIFSGLMNGGQGNPSGQDQSLSFNIPNTQGGADNQTGSVYTFGDVAKTPILYTL